jgi:hypothetical protein
VVSNTSVTVFRVHPGHGYSEAFAARDSDSGSADMVVLGDVFERLSHSVALNMLKVLRQDRRLHVLGGRSDSSDSVLSANGGGLN